MPKYIVPVIFKGQDNFIVEAASPEEAKEKAELAFNAGEEPTELGNEWQDFDRAGEPEEMEEE